MLRSFFIVVIAVIFNSCSVVVPSTTEYKINALNSIDKDINTNNTFDKTLKVQQAFGSNDLMSLHMKYSQGNNKEFRYSQSRWVTPPNKAITMEFVSLLRETELFKSVQLSKSVSKSDLILEITIEDFMQYYDNNLKSSFANVSITLTLVKADHSVLDTKTFKSKVKVKTLDADGGVVALNQALKDIMLESVKWMGDMAL